MNKNDEYCELIERAKNFHGNLDPFTIQNKFFYEELQGLTEIIEIDLDMFRGVNPQYILKIIFTRVFNFVTSFNNNYRIFNKNMAIYDDVFSACFFTVLCMFIHESKRIRGLSLRKFLYEHSSSNYNISNTRNYFDYEKTYRNSEKGKSILSEETRLRKYRERLFKNNATHYDDIEGSAIKKDSEHEWILYFKLVEDTILNPTEQKTLKHIKNLYNDINNLSYTSDIETESIIAYRKFLSKLKKLKYENFLQLHKFILEHIKKSNTYYGINLYRFERNLRLYNITNEIHLLLECQNTDEEDLIIKKSLIMKEITFPKLYENFANQKNLEETYNYTGSFLLLLDELVVSNYLVLDKFIEDGLLGSDWENLFLKTINEMAENVLYNPNEINYSTPINSQEKFEKILAEPVRDLLFQATGKIFT